MSRLLLEKPFRLAAGWGIPRFAAGMVQPLIYWFAQFMRLCRWAPAGEACLPLDHYEIMIVYPSVPRGTLPATLNAFIIVLLPLTRLLARSHLMFDQAPPGCWRGA